MLVSVAQWNNSWSTVLQYTSAGFKSRSLRNFPVCKNVCYEISSSDEYPVCKYLPDFSLYLMLIIREYVVSVSIMFTALYGYSDACMWSFVRTEPC